MIDSCHVRRGAMLSALSLILASPLAAEQGPPCPPRQVDALTASPENFRLVLENDQVRVLEFTLLPGQKDRQHTHPRRVARVISGGTLRISLPDGTGIVIEEKTGTSSWSDPAPLHDTENVGSTPVKILLVEVKAQVDDDANARK